MKKLLLFVLILFNLSAFSQQIKYEDLPNQTGWAWFESYVSSDGTVFNVGDMVKILQPSGNGNFSFIMFGDGYLLPITNLSAMSAGQETEIKKIYLVGTKRTGFSVSFRTKGAGTVYMISVENAITAKEIKSKGISSDEALADLKRAKDKLDLGLISQSQFDSLKTKLAAFIK